MSADGHGIPDIAAVEAHDMIHRAEQEEHEHEAAAKRGLPDSAAEAEYDLIHHAEEELEQLEVRFPFVFLTGPRWTLTITKNKSSSGSEGKKMMLGKH
jgi:hypothetical protein